MVMQGRSNFIPDSTIALVCIISCLYCWALRSVSLHGRALAQSCRFGVVRMEPKHASASAQHSDMHGAHALNAPKTRLQAMRIVSRRPPALTACYGCIEVSSVLWVAQFEPRRWAQANTHLALWGLRVRA
jgi:hypothetical protein